MAEKIIVYKGDKPKVYGVHLGSPTGQSVDYSKIQEWRKEGKEVEVRSTAEYERFKERESAREMAEKRAEVEVEERPGEKLYEVTYKGKTYPTPDPDWKPKEYYEDLEKPELTEKQQRIVSTFKRMGKDVTVKDGVITTTEDGRKVVISPRDVVAKVPPSAVVDVVALETQARKIRERAYQEAIKIEEQKKEVEVLKSQDVGLTPEEQRIADFERRAEALEERQKEFYTSEGFERIRDTASFLTFGRGKDIEERGVVGKMFERSLFSLMAYPIALGGFIPSTFEKLMLTGEAQTIPQLREGVKREVFVTAPSEAAQVYKEPSTYLTAAIIALPAAAGAVAAGKPVVSIKTETVKGTKTTHIQFRGQGELRGVGFKTKSGSRAVIITRGGGQQTTFLPSRYLPKITREKIIIPTKDGAKITALGVEFRGRGQPLISRTPEGIKFLTPTITEPIPLSELTAPIAAPITAVGTKVLSRVVGTTPIEQQRVASIQEIIRKLGGERGLKVKEVFFELETLKFPKKSSEIIDKTIAKEKGVVFGSTTMQQLPEDFRLVPGDIDVVFPTRTEAQLEVVVSNLAKRLRAIGEDVEVSPTNPLIIQDTTGAKVFEAKSGIDPSELSGEIAQPGGLGFLFPNIKAGVTFTTVPFGRARAITIGEQLTRKGVASAFFRPAEFGETPPAFQVSGIFPKGKRTKDIPGFIVTARGIVEVKQSRATGEIFRKTIAKSKTAIEEFIQTFTPEQQATIRELIEKGGAKIEFTALPEGVQAPSVSPMFVSTRVSPSIIGISPRPSPFISPIVSVVSPPISPSTFISPSVVSPIPSPSVISAIPSVSPSSPFSPSPVSPSIVSPSPSPFLSPSASPSSVSPSVSPSPSPSLSPSGSPSPSPSVSPSPSPVSPSPPSPSLFGKPSPRKRVSPSVSPSDKPSFDVYVREGERRQDRFRKVAEGLPKNKALRRGRDITDSFIEATYLLKKSKKKATVLDDPVPPNLSKFRRPVAKSKLPRQALIEKLRHRLDTATEVQQLSYFKERARKKKQLQQQQKQILLGTISQAKKKQALQQQISFIKSSSSEQSQGINFISSSKKPKKKRSKEIKFL